MVTQLYYTHTCTGAPASPLNFRNAVEEYHSHFSSVLFAWDSPNDDSLVDYYQYQLMKETDTFTYNTTNTSAVLPDIPYNRNVTFSVTAVNCVGSSVPLRHTVTIGRCINGRGIIVTAIDFKLIFNEKVINFRWKLCLQTSNLSSTQS